METPEDDTGLEEQLNRLVFVHLFKESIERRKTLHVWYRCIPGWEKEFFTNNFGSRLAALPPKWWIRILSAEEQALCLEIRILFYKLGSYIRIMNYTHQRKVEKSWASQSQPPSNFGIDGQENYILLSYQAVIHLSSYLQRYNHREMVEELFQSFDAAGVTKIWILGLCPAAPIWPW